MNDKLRHIIQTKPVFLFLLPVFFVLHGCLENFNFIPFRDAAILTAVYLAWSSLFAGLFWLLYRDFRKANLVAFCMMAFNFFFGAVHDLLRKWLPNSILSKHVFILPVAIILLILLIIVLKKRKKPLLKLTGYLNILLLVLLLMDTLLLASKMMKGKKSMHELPAGFAKCDTCARPDIYFILADEYAGNTELKDIFQYDDSAFIQELEKRGFYHIPETHSNYNYTPFSLASILNMDYLQLISRVRDNHAVFKSYELIRNNTLLRFLQAHQYKFYNYSVFDFEGQPARVRETFIPLKTRLITSQTFTRRFDKELRFNIQRFFKFESDLRKLTYDNKNNNEHIYKETWEQAESPATAPRFIYTHLMMPHYPYYYDSAGKEKPYETLVDGNQVTKSSYIDYLKYANKKFLALIDHIQASSKKPPIIILMGDHGFRHFEKPVDSKYYFLNFVSINLPDKNYGQFNDSLNAVNFFRTVLNTSFGQRLPYLKDSTYYLAD